MPGNYPDPSSWQAPPGAATLTFWSEARVLVVDDHRTYRLLLGSLLEKLGVAYQCCGNGREALQALVVRRFDVVITDCRMPVMDGYAMTREVRRREQVKGCAAIPVLALSASLGPEDISRCLACGMDGWLTKPIGLAQLREVLCCWLPRPQSVATTGAGTHSHKARRIGFPSRASLIEAFGSWDVVQPMLFSLIQEAHTDLAVLHQAQVSLDASRAAQCLHRLVGSVAFLGETGLESGAVALISAVRLVGVALNQSALDEFRQDVERYLEYLAHL